MKICILLSIVFSSHFAFSGNDAGGTIIKQMQAMTALNPGENLVLDFNGNKFTALSLVYDGGIETFTKSTRKSSETLAVSKELNVLNMKYLGETNESVFLMLNNADLAVEIKDTEIYKSEAFMNAIKASVESQDWISSK